jgi:hypothetical protein
MERIMNQLTITELAYANRRIQAHIREMLGWQTDGFTLEGDGETVASLILQLRTLWTENRRAMRRLLWRERMAKLYSL